MCTTMTHPPDERFPRLPVELASQATFRIYGRAIITLIVCYYG